LEEAAAADARARQAYKDSCDSLYQAYVSQRIVELQAMPVWEEFVVWDNSARCGLYYSSASFREAWDSGQLGRSVILASEHALHSLPGD